MPRFKIVAALIALFASASLIAEVAGTYEIEFVGMAGAPPSTLTMEKDDKGNYSGEISGGAGGEALDIDEITVDGDKFSFTITTPETEGISMSLEYSGEVDGDKISGTISTDWGEVEFEGTRQAEEEEDSEEDSEATDAGDQS